MEKILATHEGDREQHLWDVPRPMGRERFLIHTFSARRRPGDVQFFLDSLQAQHDGAMIFTISLDAIIDETYGGVSRVNLFVLSGFEEYMKEQWLACSQVHLASHGLRRRVKKFRHLPALIAIMLQGSCVIEIVFESGLSCTSGVGPNPNRQPFAAVYPSAFGTSCSTREHWYPRAPCDPS